MAYDPFDMEEIRAAWEASHHPHTGCDGCGEPYWPSELQTLGGLALCWHCHEEAMRPEVEEVEEVEDEG